MEIEKRWVIYSEHSGNHVVSLLRDGSYACDCLGWTMHYPRINCKHIREVMLINPEPINKENWLKLKNKRKVIATLNAFKESNGVETSENNTK